MNCSAQYLRPQSDKHLHSYNFRSSPPTKKRIRPSPDKPACNRCGKRSIYKRNIEQEKRVINDCNCAETKPDDDHELFEIVLINLEFSDHSKPPLRLK